MEKENRSVVLDVVKDEESPTILFHTSDDPYHLKYISMDRDWKSTPLGIQECRFLPKSIKTYKNRELAVIYSGISASVINTNLDINGMEEEVSLLFPFVVEDVCPSLFCSEFVYSSVEKCNLYSISQERIKFSVNISNEEVVSTRSLSIQPSAHPLIFYMTHPKGVLAIDFRAPSPNTLFPKQNCSHLQRIDGDWNHYLMADDSEFGICDIRNPVVYNQCWRYTGSLRKLNCYQTQDSNAVDFHILFVTNRIFLTTLLTAIIQQPSHFELQASSFHRSYLDLSSETPTPIIPSLNNNPMQLLYSSRHPFDSILLSPFTTPSSSQFDRILGSFVTVGWRDATHGRLGLFTATINDSVNHIFACDREEREWESRMEISPFENQERLHTLDVNRLVHKHLEAVEGSVSHLQRLVESGFLSQPKSVYSIQTELITRMNVTLPLETIQQWLITHKLKAIQVDGEQSIHSTVWVNETHYQQEMDVFASSHHPIDRKRIETLSELWNKQ